MVSFVQMEIPLPKKITVFSPNGTLQKKRDCDNWPVVFITGNHSLARGGFMFFVKTPVNHFNQMGEMVEHQNSGARVDSTLL